MDTIEKLRDFAEIGPPLSSIAEFESDYRFLVCGKYIAFYRVNGDDVHIDRVFGFNSENIISYVAATNPEGVRLRWGG